jgi:uncharacterized protein (DUF488 family)
MENALYTIGYEGSDAADFVATLQNAGVETLIDIRFHPVSRRKGFSKSAMAAALKDGGIGYVHLSGLGNPNHQKNVAHEVFEAQFDAHMQSDIAQHDLTKAVDIAKKSASCLLCYEKNHEECHRNIVADYLASRTGQNITHLRIQKGSAAQHVMNL